MVGNPSVVSNLRTALPLEAQLNLSYRLYARLVHFMGVNDVAPKLDSFGDDAHDAMKLVTKQLLFLTSDPTGKEDAGAEAVSYSIDVASPDAPTFTGVLQAALAKEVSIARLYDDEFVPTAYEQRDEETRHVWKDLIHQHRKNQRWLEKQLRLVGGLSESEYIAEKL